MMIIYCDFCGRDVRPSDETQTCTKNGCIKLLSRLREVFDLPNANYSDIIEKARELRERSGEFVNALGEALNTPGMLWGNMIARVAYLRSLDDQGSPWRVERSAELVCMIEKLQSLRWVGFADGARQNMDLVVDVLIQHLKE